MVSAFFKACLHLALSVIWHVMQMPCPVMCDIKRIATSTLNDNGQATGSIGVIHMTATTRTSNGPMSLRHDK